MELLQLGLKAGFGSKGLEIGAEDVELRWVVVKLWSLFGSLL